MNIDAEQLEKLLWEAIRDKDVWEKVAELFGEQQPFKPSTVSNWVRRDNGHLPNNLLKGAAFWICGAPQVPTSGPGIPADIASHYPQSVPRVHIWAEEIWHVFLGQLNQDEDKLDVQVWRFWKGLRSVHQTKKHGWLSHATLTDGPPDNFEPIGTELPFVHIAGLGGESESTNPHVVQVQCEVTDKPNDVGYRLTAQDALKANKTSTTSFEFVGGMNVIPCRKSYLLACLPTGSVEENIFLPIRAISFAPQVSPIAFIHQVLASRSGHDSVKFQRLLEPWGATADVSELTKDLDIPNELRKAIKRDWPSAPKPETDQRAFLSTFDYPHPLTYQVFVYPLP